MSSSKGKTIGLVLLVALLVLVGLRITPLFFAPFGIFSSVFNTIKHVIGDSIHFGNGCFFDFPFVPLLSLVFFIIWIMVIVWVYRDAERKGMNGLLWALLVLIGNLIGLIIYLIIRTESRQQKPQPPEGNFIDCPHCNERIQDKFAFCPNCGEMLKPRCPKCKADIREEWKVCPHCGARLKGQ
ncbi:MAG: zinc ribbon domain-containing protein [Candidatus Aminicenantes bacterium]|nr:zinc ribbon domain-containing protein [Candidatus Aminicenantes bacterium]